MLFTGSITFADEQLQNSPVKASQALTVTDEKCEPTLSDDTLAKRGCCSWHKGVCGCRDGRVTCCDGHTSPSCTCHHEDEGTGVVN